ncbi:unnamed protein product, partial [Polarella glacialis]
GRSSPSGGRLSRQQAVSDLSNANATSSSMNCHESPDTPKRLQLISNEISDDDSLADEASKGRKSIPDVDSVGSSVERKPSSAIVQPGAQLAGTRY